MLIYAADDEKLALGLLEEAITEAIPDTEATYFRKSSELLAAAKENCPDVVFLDVEMPGLTGIELAKELQAVNPKINLIFVTGYAEYLNDAMQLFCSGYITKPVTADAVRRQMEHLRFPAEKAKRISVRTFGNFDVFVEGRPVEFRSPKSKELLAYLVDRQGAVVSRSEAAGILYEDDYSRNTQKELSRIAKRLSEDLDAAGIGEIFLCDGSYQIDLAEIDCDLVKYFADPSSVRYNGEYMEQYSWGEFEKSNFR